VPTKPDDAPPESASQGRAGDAPTVGGTPPPCLCGPGPVRPRFV